MKHTPGPWITELDTTGQNHKTHIRADVLNGYAQICEINRSVDLKLGGVNARLIAAAPEMLELLKTILNEQLDLGTQGDAEYISKLACIIAKAEGV